MKKSLLLLLTGLFVFNTVISQDGEKRVMSKGKSAINLYYGYNAFTSLYKRVITEATTGSGLDIKFKGLGPIGLVYEYMITDGVGIGADLCYNTISANTSYLGTNSAGQDEIYFAQAKFTTFRAMFRSNFHFTKSEKFDAYAFVSLGYKNSTFSFTTSEPGYNGSVTLPFIPIALKPGMGFRYFFTDNVGLNCEIALGTPLIAGGLSLKF